MEYNGVIFGSTKGDLKAQIHSSGHARFKNKTQRKINSNIPFSKMVHVK